MYVSTMNIHIAADGTLTVGQPTKPVFVPDEQTARGKKEADKAKAKREKLANGSQVLNEFKDFCSNI